MWPVSHTENEPSGEHYPSPAMRCAIYARVSVADTQPSSFTSLTAQIEACEQYIASQRVKDWGLAYPPFTDDGLSGSNLDRPGLRSLLKLVDQGEVEVIVVYRMDRITRSVFDLETLLPLFELKGVALASITEQIDTHTPVGRLSLNLLTTFAEYERETIGERTRDKLSATRRRGGWQGKGTPLGYGVDFEQRLVVINHEANLVREIFRRYLAVETMAEMMAWLALPVCRAPRATDPGRQSADRFHCAIRRQTKLHRCTSCC